MLPETEMDENIAIGSQSAEKSNSNIVNQSDSQNQHHTVVRTHVSIFHSTRLVLEALILHDLVYITIGVFVLLYQYLYYFVIW